jgi:AcrR family transcriptional regulator
VARTRKVETDDILDAVERVVARLGAVGLSLDAVAKEAGISKSRVVYDYKSKTALIEAILDRHMAQQHARLQELIAESADTPHPELYGRMKQMLEAPTDSDNAVCMAITASMTSEKTIHDRMCAHVNDDFDVMQNGPRPRAAQAAHMALIGFYMHEWFGFRTWTQDERRQIVQDVEAVYLNFPDKHS